MLIKFGCFSLPKGSIISVYTWIGNRWRHCHVHLLHRTDNILHEGQFILHDNMTTLHVLRYHAVGSMVVVLPDAIVSVTTQILSNMGFL